MRALTLAVVCGFGAGLLMWLLISAAGNLPGSDRSSIQTALLLIAVVTGATSGLLISRRRTQPRAVAFSATIGAFGGAICGATYTIIVGVAFFATYGGSPVSVVDALALVLAFPVFGLLGAMGGAAIGGPLGGFGGYLATRLPPLASPPGR